VQTEIERRAAVHAALGEPLRLAIVDELSSSDRAPSDLAARFGLAGNLLAPTSTFSRRCDSSSARCRLATAAGDTCASAIGV